MKSSASSGRQSGRQSLAAATLVALLSVAGVIGSSAEAGEIVDYLSGGEVAAVSGGTLGVFAAGRWSRSANADVGPRWTEPPGIDRWFTRVIGGEPTPGPSNLMDTDRAALFNILIVGTAVGALDAAYPREDRTKDILQGQFLYYSGALAQKGLHDVFKGLVRRQRPLVRLAPEVAARRAIPSPPRDNESFFSGHASSAFFAMTFLNKQVRDVLRRELDGRDYDRWSWVSPTASYLWASFVALSRVHAYQHYFTDVAVGALAGWIVGEVFFGLIDVVDDHQSDEFHGSRLLFRVTVSF